MTRRADRYGQPATFDDPCALCDRPAVILIGLSPRCAEHWDAKTGEECDGQGDLFGGDAA